MNPTSNSQALISHLQGKRGLILGLADAHSIAYGCAEAAQAASAQP